MDGLKKDIAGSKVFIVDDEEKNLLLLERFLTMKGYHVQTFLNGKEALKGFQIKLPDLILLDINLPDISGYEMCQQMKSDNLFTDIPVIFLSGISDTDAKLQAFQCGGVDYVTKPVTLEELNVRIQTHLEIKYNRQAIVLYADQLQRTIDDMSSFFETGNLVANVVHDTKKFTTAISMQLESIIIPKIKEKLPMAQNWVEELIIDLSEVHSNSAQCTEFLDSLLSINRKNEEIEPVDIIKIIHQAVDLVSYDMIQEGITWEIENGQTDEKIVLGNGQLIRVFVNLIVNAIDALKKQEIRNPKIVIRVEDNTDQVNVTVIDNGNGMTLEILEGIRKGMILSTKGKSGNGFGVSGLTKIVKKLGGTIDIRSQVGKGAAFIVSLKKR